MTTAIPPTEFDRIIRTNSSPETIVASLNEAEATHSRLLRKPHGNARRVYPFWKTCEVCSKPFPCLNKAQATRNLTCSRECASRALSEKAKLRTYVNHHLVTIACAVCGKKVQKPRAWLKKVAHPTCSRQCNGVLRGQEWAKYGSKGRSGWTEESRASYQSKMTGENNPAWKGGVTIFKTHGNYVGVRYVRCPPEFLAMARKDGYVMEHRLIVAKAMGRLLLRTEVVHHVDHDPTNNRPENLQLFASNSDHKRYEHRGSPAPIWPR